MDYKESSCILRDYILYYSICYLSNTGNSSHMCLCYMGTVSKRQMVDGGLSCNLDEAAWFSYFWNPEWSFHLHKVAWSQSEIWWCWSSHHLGVSGSTMLLGRGSTGDVSGSQITFYPSAGRFQSLFGEGQFSRPWLWISSCWAYSADRDVCWGARQSASLETAPSVQCNFYFFKEKVGLVGAWVTVHYFPMCMLLIPCYWVISLCKAFWVQFNTRTYNSLRQWWPPVLFSFSFPLSLAITWKLPWTLA